MPSFFSPRWLTAVCVVVIVFVWGRMSTDDRELPIIDRARSSSTASPTPQPNTNIQPLTPDADLNKIARSITVKIGVSELIGSGTIVGVENEIYTIITNAHVLRSASPPYRITTSDRLVHKAQVVNYQQLKNYDLAVLQFRALGAKYTVAEIGKSGSLQVGDRLFVGGFTKQSSQRNSDGFLLQSGAVSIILDRGIDSGYRLGYTHQIFRGMSGGAVLDHEGALVGINGLLNDPVWKTSSTFSDGSIPCEPLQLLIDRSSLAIPIDDIIKLIPRSKWWQQEPLYIVKNIPDTPQEAEKRVILQQGAKKALSCH